MNETEELAISREKGTGWGQNRRLEFIDFRLLWEGQINRSDLTEFFGISVPQASLDLTLYQKVNPKNVSMSASAKVYLKTPEFEPFITPKDTSRFLTSLLAVNLEMMGREMSFIGNYPEFGAVISPPRNINPEILFKVLQAIRKILAIEIEYQSFNRPEPTIRTISPHAIAYDGFRWHMRAYCHEHKDFRDFVFARILNIQSESASTVDPKTDDWWYTTIKLILEPNPALSLAQKRIIELDYDMKEGKTTIQTKPALLFYLLKRLGLDKNQDAPEPEQQIILVNRIELAPYLNKMK